MAIAPQMDRPLGSAKVPKIMPKGIAPMINGIVALAPFMNSVDLLRDMAEVEWRS
jgi:hypothetical protein